MMQKIQRFGGAMFTPVLLFAFAGVCIGIGTLFTTEAIMGSLALPSSMWYQCWNLILQGGWTVFNQLPLLFVVGLPIGLAKKQNGRACMEALVIYLTFNYFLSTMLAQWGPTFGVDFSAEVGSTSGLAMVAGIKTLDMGMMGALIISGVAIYLHNKFFDVELPEIFGTFSGSTFVVMIGFLVMIPIALAAAFIWPNVQHFILNFQDFMKSSGSIGIWVFTFLERMLIPTGLHHFIYTPFYYDNAIVSGGLYSWWSQNLPALAASSENLKALAPQAGFCLTGMSKVFACPGIALAFYATAKKEKKGKVAGLLIPITLTAIICGVTEPIEYTFLFIAPMLFVVHAILAATLAMVANLCGVVGIFGGGLIEWLSFNWIPLMGTHAMTYVIQIAVGLAFTAIYFFVFRFLILKLNLKTPGREDEDEETKLVSKAEYRESKQKGATKEDERVIFAQNILDGLGGKENIKDVTNCATRLRVSLVDGTKVKDANYFKAMGAHGLVHNGNAVQVIVGLSVPKVRDEFERLL